MKIGVYSDLHMLPENFHLLRYFDFKTPDVILFCGDITLSFIMDDFLKYVRKQTDKPIVMCYGNHEFYNSGKTIEETTIDLNKILDKYDVYHEPVFINNYHFIPSTLFPEYGNLNDVHDQVKLQTTINDFYYIKDHTIQNMNEYHKNDVKHIYNQVNANESYKVILTHYPPFKELMSPYFPESYTTNYFYNQFVINNNCRDKIKLWAYGHDHYSQTKEVNGILCVSNQKGYVGEAIFKHFKYNKIIELERI